MVKKQVSPTNVSIAFLFVIGASLVSTFFAYKGISVALASVVGMGALASPDVQPEPHRGKQSYHLSEPTNMGVHEGQCRRQNSTVARWLMQVMPCQTTDTVQPFIGGSARTTGCA